MDAAVRFVHTTLTPVAEYKKDHNADGYMKSSNALNISTPSPRAAEKGSIMSDELRVIFDIVNYVFLTGIISFCGVITNVINFIVFLRGGLTDSVTISLLGLAISDLGSSMSYVWMSMCINPLFAQSDIPFNSLNVQYITAGWPHVCFARITCFITAYITFERCLCIIKPLKVKSIITPRRSFFVILSIFLIMIASVSPVFYAIGLGPVFNKEKNRTLIDLAYAKNGVEIENASLLINAVSQLISFLLVIVFSLFLVNGLREKTKWRQKSSSVGEGSSSRDNKVVKMVLAVAFVFIVCYLPSMTNHIIMTTSEEYSITGRYKNIFLTSWSFLNAIEATNSTVNIFIYYNKNTKYRKDFRRLFGFDPENDTSQK